MDWHVVHEDVVVTDLDKDVLDGEPIILWDCKVLEATAHDILLLTADDVLQKAEKELDMGIMTY